MTKRESPTRAELEATLGAGYPVVAELVRSLEGLPTEKLAELQWWVEGCLEDRKKEAKRG